MFNLDLFVFKSQLLLDDWEVGGETEDLAPEKPYMTNLVIIFLGQSAWAEAPEIC